MTISRLVSAVILAALILGTSSSVATAQDTAAEGALQAESPERVSLSLAPKAPVVSSFTIEVQSRMAVNMLLIPKTTLMGIMTIRGDGSIGPGTGDAVVQRLSAHTASMSYYEPGGANRDIPREQIVQTLFASGLPVPEFPVTMTLNRKGTILSAEGVPASFTKFYEISLLEFPEHPVKPGESWGSSQTIPVSPDPNSETVLCQAVATFSLSSFDAVADSADIAFTTSMKSLPAAGSGTAVIAGTAEGIVRVRLSDGVPRNSDSTSKSRLDFGGGNVIDLEQRIRSDFSANQAGR